jgi:hypothetical protein
MNFLCISMAIPAGRTPRPKSSTLHWIERPPLADKGHFANWPIGAVHAWCDGFRFQVIKDGSDVRLYSKSGADYCNKLPSMRNAFAKLPTNSAILDGELCLMDPRGGTNFWRLITQMRTRWGGVAGVPCPRRRRALTGRLPGLGVIAFAFRQLRCALHGIRRLALLGLDALAA